MRERRVSRLLSLCWLLWDVVAAVAPLLMPGAISPVPAQARVERAVDQVELPPVRAEEGEGLAVRWGPEVIPETRSQAW